MADGTLQPGDEVSWNTPQGETKGRVKKKLTSPTKIKGHRAAATTDDPQFLVESDASGNEAAHKPESIRRR